MWILFTYWNLRALRFKSSQVFLKRPPDAPGVICVTAAGCCPEMWAQERFFMVVVFVKNLSAVFTIVKIMWDKWLLWVSEFDFDILGNKRIKKSMCGYIQWKDTHDIVICSIWYHQILCVYYQLRYLLGLNLILILHWTWTCIAEYGSKIAIALTWVWVATKQRHIC